MRSMAKFGKSPTAVREECGVTLTVSQSNSFEVDDVVYIKMTVGSGLGQQPPMARCIVTEVLDSTRVTLRNHPTPLEWIKLFLKFAWRGARRWLSRACARFRGARS